jgi:hypothetical protein
MNEAGLKKLLKTTGLPVTYHHYKKPPKPPYLVYLRTHDKNISSDAGVHGKFKNYKVELYTTKKDLATEAIVEAVLGPIDPDYTTEETYIESEALYQVVYLVSITEKYIVKK